MLRTLSSGLHLSCIIKTTTFLHGIGPPILLSWPLHSWSCCQPWLHEQQNLMMAVTFCASCLAASTAHQLQKHNALLACFCRSKYLPIAGVSEQKRSSRLCKEHHKRCCQANHWFSFNPIYRCNLKSPSFPPGQISLLSCTSVLVIFQLWKWGSQAS